MSIVLKKFVNSFFATCPKGLEGVLEQELINLGATSTKKSSRGVHFKISKENIIDIILYSRIASRLQIILFDFDVKKEKDVYLGLKSINWPRFFNLDQTFKFNFTQGVSETLKKKSQFKNTLYLAMVGKDALCDRFNAEVGKRPYIDTKNPDVSITCHLSPKDVQEGKKERLTVMIDLLGSTLGHRGYRLRHQEAPVRENLAAGLIDLAKWDHETENFIDLTCGSGTFLFEAIIKKLSISPRFTQIPDILDGHKKWNFQKYKFLDSISRSNQFNIKLRAALRNYKEKIETKSDPIIHGNDFSRKTMDQTQTGFQRIGWHHLVSFSTKNAYKFDQFQDEKNLLFSNPPFGERLDAIDDKVATLYHEIGENFKQNFKSSRLSIMSSDKQLLGKIRLRADQKNPFAHGPLDCLLYTYHQL